MISRFVIAFLLRSKHLLIPWLQSLQSSAVISSLIKKVYMQDSTFQLVWKRRISSFKLFVQICGGLISLWSWLGGKSLWPYLFKAYFRPSPGTCSTVLVADCSVMFSCSVTLTTILNLYPRKVSHILTLSLAMWFCYCHYDTKQRHESYLSWDSPSFASFTAPWLLPHNQIWVSLMGNESHVTHCLHHTNQQPANSQKQSHLADL